MALQIVYVLTSGEDDLYFEQFYVSALSARKHNMAAKIILLTDKDTEAALQNGYRREAAAVADSVAAVDLHNVADRMMRSRWLKTSMRSLIDGDFLFIDCDTVVCGALDGVAEGEGDLRAVPDGHTKSSADKRFFHSITQKASFVGFHAGYEDMYFNSGGMFARDTPKCREFFALWHALWQETCKRGIKTDQPSFNEANYRMNGFIKEMSGIYNCQNVTGIRYLPTAKVLHYFSSGINANDTKRPFYALADWALLKEIKECGGVTGKVQKIIDNPLSPDLFADGEFVAADSDVFAFMTSGIIDCFRVLRHRLPALYRALDDMLLRKRDKVQLRRLKAAELKTAKQKAK